MQWLQGAHGSGSSQSSRGAVAGGPTGARPATCGRPDGANHKKATIGFLATSNRVCVALTRARESLLIVGSAELLRGGPEEGCSDTTSQPARAPSTCPRHSVSAAAQMSVSRASAPRSARGLGVPTGAGQPADRQRRVCRDAARGDRLPRRAADSRRGHAPQPEPICDVGRQPGVRRGARRRRARHDRRCVPA